MNDVDMMLAIADAKLIYKELQEAVKKDDNCSKFEWYVTELETANVRKNSAIKKFKIECSYGVNLIVEFIHNYYKELPGVPAESDDGIVIYDEADPDDKHYLIIDDKYGDFRKWDSKVIKGLAKFVVTYYNYYV